WAMSPDGHRVATGERDNTVRLWDLTAADPSAAPVVRRRHDQPPHIIAFTAAARRLATACFVKTIRLWDLTQADPSVDPIILRGHEEQLFGLAISNQWLAMSSKDKPLRLWDLDADALVAR